MGYLSYRELEERHIVVGEPIPDDLREADSGDDQNDGANDG